MGADNGIQWKGAINDRFQRTGLETVMDIPFATDKPFAVLYNFKQGITSYSEVSPFLERPLAL